MTDKQYTHAEVEELLEVATDGGDWGWHEGPEDSIGRPRWEVHEGGCTVLLNYDRVTAEFIAAAPTIARQFVEQAKEIERLREDKARLDWLDKHCTRVADSERYLSRSIYWGGGTHRDVRAAVDEAMK